MILLLCHLIGDYVLQSHVMATRKTSSWWWALIHAAFYSIPFAVLLALTAPPVNGFRALVIILWTHAIIDHYRIAAGWCRLYGVGHPGVWFAMVHAEWNRQMWNWRLAVGPKPAPPEEPVFVAPPPFLGVWLTIIVDNTMHLAINAAAVYLATGGLP